MLTIEDKTSRGWSEFIEFCLKPVFSIIPKEDFIGINKILILDECPDKAFIWAGAFYSIDYDTQSAHIELYPEKIINGMPKFLPKIRFFKKYSVIRIFLHELGHHHFGIQNMEGREIEANKYMTTYLKKIYGYWNFFFNFMGLLQK